MPISTTSRMTVTEVKLLRVAAKELARLRQENARLRQENICLRLIERPGQDYATHPGRQLKPTTKRQEGTARENE